MIHMLVPGNITEAKRSTEDYLDVYKCSICGCKFAASKLDAIEVYTDYGSHENYFKCPTCDTYRHCYEITDPELRKKAECISNSEMVAVISALWKEVTK